MRGNRSISSTGRSRNRTYYSRDEIDRICVDALESVGLYPRVPEPIRIDRFIEKRFGVSAAYEDLGPGILGMTKFGRTGVQAVIVSQRLDNENSQVSERRIRSTLAHEAGHGLLHEHLFAPDETMPLFGDCTPTGIRVLCRDEPHTGSQTSHQGNWWEYQANRAIGSLLLPRGLVGIALEEFSISSGGLGLTHVDRGRRLEATSCLAETFDVNPVVARIRFDELYQGDLAAQQLL